MGLSPLRPQHAGFLRGFHLIETSLTRMLARLTAELVGRPARRIDAAPPRMRAGVLVPLFRAPEGIELLFTRRTDTVLTHKGQISFPGGQHEPSDAGLVETALRESYEEIGLDPGRVQVLGELDDMFTSV
ncbi:MAG: CoA pyrophosphatase, partial [Candidatus Dormibacteraeota bacterium]|nr:CoA pyrophosphatase [Candidatus Dormibacteraeota bacterium]